jgi:hypothetical protein
LTSCFLLYLFVCLFMSICFFPNSRIWLDGLPPFLLICFIFCFFFLQFRCTVIISVVLFSEFLFEKKKDQHYIKVVFSYFSLHSKHLESKLSYFIIYYKIICEQIEGWIQYKRSIKFLNCFGEFRLNWG